MAFPLTVSVVSMGPEWRVVSGGTHHSNHRKKARAVDEGRRVAKGHDGPAKLKIQGQDGRWQDIREY